MSETIIGKVSLAPCGEFQMGKLYKKLSTVSFEGSNYIAAQDNQNVSLDNYGTWYLLSKVGNTISNIILLSTSGYTSTYRVNFTDGTFFDFEVNDLITKTSQLTNDSGFITNQVDDLQNYLTKDQESSYAQISIDNSTYQIIVRLFNSDDEVLSTQSVTMPIEKTIINASYENATITLIARDNSTFVIPINDILLNTHTIAEIDLKGNINAADLAAAIGAYTAKQIDDLIDPINEELTLMESNIEKKAVSIVGYGQLTDSLNGQIDEPILKGNTTQVQTTGKNLFDGNNPTGDVGLTTSTIVDNTTTISSTNTSTIPYCRWEFDANEGDVIRCAGIIKSSNGRIVRQLYDGSSWSGYSERNYIDGKTISSIQYTVASGITKVRFSLYANNVIPSGNTSANYLDVIVTKNNEDMTYEPYTNGQPSPTPTNPSPIIDVTGTQEVVVSNKNSLTGEYEHLGFWNTTVGQNTSQFNTNSSMLGIKSKVIPGATYTLSRDKITNRFSVAALEEITSTNGLVLATNNSAHNITITIPIGYTAIAIYLSNKGESSEGINLQLEEGTTATSYVPHKGLSATLHLGDIHLRKIENYQDKLYKENDKWWLSNIVKEKILNGTENITLMNDKVHTFLVPLNAKSVTGISSHYKKIASSKYDIDTGIYLTSSIFAVISDLRFSTVEDFKAWLTTNNVVVDYVKSGSPTITEITPQNYPELYVDLEQLAAMQTYKPETHILIIPSSGNGVILDFIYWVDDRVILDNKITTLESQVALLE